MDERPRFKRLRFSVCAVGRASVPGLVLVMPPVEVVVEEDDASRRHACYDAPAGRGGYISDQMILYLHIYKTDV